METYIGVDIGINGGISLINKHCQIIECKSIPVIEVLVGGKKRSQYDILGINNIIKDWIFNYKIVRAGMERLRAIPNQASQVAFSMGGGSMLFKTLFTVYSIPFVEYEPRAWQKEIFNRAGVQYDKDTTKIASVAAAKVLFPGFSFKKSERCRVDSPDLTDSANIALYTKLKY